MEQQFNAYLHTSKQIKQRLSKMTSALDTQEVATSQLAEAAQVTTMDEKTQFEQNQVEEQPSKRLEISILVSTIDLTHSEEEDERVSHVLVTIETGNGNDLQNLTTFLNDKNGKASSPLPQPQPSS